MTTNMGLLGIFSYSCHREGCDHAITLMVRLTLGCRYTADEDFLNADAVFDFIGDPPEERFDLDFCTSLVDKQFVS